MYTLSDETRGGSSARNREPSPFTGQEARVTTGSGRRQGNDTFTAAWGTPNDYTSGGSGRDVRATPNRTPMPTIPSSTTNTTSNGGNSRKKKNADDENPFRLPPLSSAEQAYMVRKAKESSIALVDHAHTLDGPVEWQYTGKFRGIQMYRGEGTSNEADVGMEYLCGVTTMAGTLNEVSAYFDQSTTERMRAKKADDVLDCAVLYMLEQGDAKNPFYRVAVKYTSFEGPSTFSRARDYVYLECQNTFRHASGRRGWVLSMHSIKLPNCPEMDGTVRGSMYHSGYVFVEAEKPGYMDVMHSLQINFKATKRLPSFMLNSALKRRITSVIKISREIQMARMGQQTLLKKEDLMPKNSRSLCANCSRKFTLFIRKTRCRMCGQVVCQSCAPQVDWDTPDEGTKKTRICMKCYRTGSGMLAPSSVTGTDKNSAEYSDDEEMIEEAAAEEEAHAHADEDEDGEDGLEEQTEVSAFAQSRFTRATADSLFSFTSEFHIHDLGASSANNKTATGGFAWKDNVGTSYDQTPDVLEDSTFEANMSYQSNFYDTKVYLTPEDTDEELDKRARRYDPNFRETSIVDKRVSRAMGPNSPPPPPPPLEPPQLVSQLSAGALKEHNMRFQSVKKYPAAPAPAPLTPQKSGKIVSIKDIRSNFMKGTVKGDLPAEPNMPQESARFSQDDDNYLSHPPSAILNQVRANRSRTIQFASEGDYRSPEMMQSIEDEHKKRMAELNKATSNYASECRVTEPEANDDEPFTLEHLQTTEEPSLKSTPMFASIEDYYENRQSTGQSPRESAVAPTEADQDADDYYAPSFLELSQVRANRSHTIEFIPQFMQPETEEDAESGSSHEEEPQVQVGVQQQTQRRSADTKEQRVSTEQYTNQRRSADTKEQRASTEQYANQRRSADIKDQRVTEQYANLQIPGSEVIEMMPSPRAGEEDDEGEKEGLDDPDRPRFSQTMIPILDYNTEERSSEAQSISGLTIEIETRESRKFSDIPIMDYGLDRSMTGSVRESDFDYELINRSTAVIMEQVHANRARPDLYESDDDNFRSTEIMKDIEEEHKRRMAELNRIAMDYTGNRISRLNFVDEDRESMNTIDFERMSGSYRESSQQLDSLEEDSDTLRPSEAPPTILENSHSPRLSRDTTSSSRSDFNSNYGRVSSPKGYVGSRMTSLEFMPEELEYKQPTTTKSRFTNLEFSLDLLEPRDTIDEKIGSPRESTVFDEELINRSTAVIMDQVRANRERVPKDMDMSDGDIRSTAIMKDIELEHKKRMAELNRIALDNVGERLSTFPTEGTRDSEDGFVAGNRSMLRQVNTSLLDSGFRPSTIMGRYQNAHEAKMEALREKVRLLDEQCRASMASIFSAEELDFAELDAELEQEVAAKASASATKPKYKHRDFPPTAQTSAAANDKGDENSSRIANLYSVKNLKPVAARRNPVMMHERVSSHTLYQQIAQLTQLQSQMALAKDAEDEEAYKQRIKEQYQLLRTLKLRGY